MPVVILFAVAAFARSCSVTARLTAIDADDAADFAVLQSRIAALELLGEVRLVAPLHLELTVRRATSADLVRWLTATGELALGVPRGSDEVPLFQPRDVADARPDGATLVLTLTPEGQARMSEGTAAHLGEALRLTLDGQVLAEPVLREPITGERLVVQAPVDSARWAAVTAAAVRAPLSGTWSVEIVSERGRCGPR